LCCSDRLHTRPLEIAQFDPLGRFSHLLGGHLRDTRTVSVHLNEPHWIAGRVSKKTEYNDAGNFESWHIDCAARSLYERESSGNVWHPQVDTSLFWVFTDSTLDWSGNRDTKLSCLI